MWDPRYPEPCYSGACNNDPFSPLQVANYPLMTQSVVAQPVVAVKSTQVEDDDCADPCEKKHKSKTIDVEVKMVNGEYAGISLPPPPNADDFSLYSPKRLSTT